MYEKKATRQIRALHAANERLLEERDEARQERDDAVQLNGRLATKVEQNGTADAKEMARLQSVAETWAKHSREDRRGKERLARAAVRYWAEIGRLRKTLAERDSTIKVLQDRLDAHEGGDRAVARALPPSDELRSARRKIAAQDAQIAGLDKQLAILEAANVRTDWRLAKRAGAAKDPAAPALPAAS